MYGIQLRVVLHTLQVLIRTSGPLSCLCWIRLSIPLWLFLSCLSAGLSTITHITTVPPSLYDNRSTGGAGGYSRGDLVVFDATRVNGVWLHLVHLSDGSELDTLCIVGGEQSLDFNQVLR